MKQLEEVMSKEVTRKEFLTTLGFGVASILGFSGIMKFVFGRGSTASTSSKTSSLGYGSSAYGGGRESAAPKA